MKKFSVLLPTTGIQPHPQSLHLQILLAQGGTNAVAEGQTGIGAGAQVLPVFVAPALPGVNGTLWKYKGIYRIAGARVGEWSEVVSIAVAG